jgi:hypothetical protein
MSSSLERIEIFFLAYAFLISSTVIILSALMVTQIDVYLAAFAIEYFVAILATSPHNPGETRRERIIGVMLLVVFTGIVIERVLLLLK